MNCAIKSLMKQAREMKPIVEVKNKMRKVSTGNLMQWEMQSAAVRSPWSGLLENLARENILTTCHHSYPSRYGWSATNKDDVTKGQHVANNASRSKRKQIIKHGFLSTHTSTRARPARPGRRGARGA